MDAWQSDLNPLSSWRNASRGLSGWRSQQPGGFSGLGQAASGAYSGLGQTPDGGYSGLGQGQYGDLGFSGLAQGPTDYSWNNSYAAGSAGEIAAVTSPGAIGNGTTQAAFDAAAAAAAGQQLGKPRGIIDPASSGLQLGNAKGLPWESVTQWSDLAAEAGSKWGVDPALILSAIAMESGGKADARNPASSSFGLLQIQPEFHQESAAALGYDLKTPEGQVGYWAALMAGKAPGQAVRGNTPIERYINNYQGPEAGQGDPNYTASYQHDVEVLMGMIKSTGATQSAPSGGSIDGTTTGPGSGVSSPETGMVGHVADTWGGYDAPIVQSVGTPDDNLGAQRAANDYCRQEFGIDGHCGVDYQLPVGTRLFAPITGTVVNVGGEYYKDGAGGTGEVRIQADNGDILILGHLASASVQQGQRIEAGMELGISGQADSRPESARLHMEVRVAQPDGSYTIADPQSYFNEQGGANPAGPTQLTGDEPTANYTSDPIGQAVADAADDYVNVNYVYGSVPREGQDPTKTGWDCSGFVSYIADINGISAQDIEGGVPDGSHYQAEWAIENGRWTPMQGIDLGALQPGDLIFFDTGANGGGGQNTVSGEASRATHVGIYLGDGKMINAMQECQPGMTNGVDCGTGIVDVTDSYWGPKAIGSASLAGLTGGAAATPTAPIGTVQTNQPATGDLAAVQNAIGAKYDTGGYIPYDPGLISPSLTGA